MNGYRKHHSGTYNGFTLLEVVVIIAVVGIILMGIIFAIGQAISSKTGTQVTTGQAYVGTFTTPPPKVLTVPAPVVFNVVTKEYRQVGAAPPVISGPATPLRGASITFRLSTADASVDGGAIKVVTTDAAGNARVNLLPVRDGSDELYVNFRHGVVTADEPPVGFEVDVP